MEYDTWRAIFAIRIPFIARKTIFRLPQSEKSRWKYDSEASPRSEYVPNPREALDWLASQLFFMLVKPRSNNDCLANFWGKLLATLEKRGFPPLSTC